MTDIKEIKEKIEGMGKSDTAFADNWIEIINTKSDCSPDRLQGLIDGYNKAIQDVLDLLTTIKTK